MSKLPFFLAAFALCAAARGANPYLPLWEYIPDGEPYVFDDPDKPGEKRVYIYGSHDAMRNGRACGREQVVWSASVKDLNRWRFDGVIFRSIYGADGQPLNGDCLGDVLFTSCHAFDASAASVLALVCVNRLTFDISHCCKRIYAVLYRN